MSRIKLVAIGIVLGACSVVWGADNGVSLAINFGAGEPDGAEEGFVEGAAGVAGTQNWNNTFGPSSFGDEEFFLDVGGEDQATDATVEWFSNNTWSSDGRGAEDTNDAPEGNDRALMLGYLDTTDTSITEVVVDGLPDELASGFDVFLYMQGGVLDRGGTYTVSDGAGQELVRDNIASTVFDGTYIEGEEGNYLLFEGLSGSEVTVLAQATTVDLFRGPLNAIEICEAGACLPKPTPVAGRENIGTQSVVNVSRENEVVGPPGDPTPGLAQEWYAEANPGSKEGVDDIFDNNTPMVAPFQAGHGATWWTGSDAAFGDLVKYPDEVQPPFNADNNDNYVVRATGELLIPESGSYSFADGVDDFTYLAIDTDKSGTAGDNPDEVLINDNTWTNVFRDANGGGEGWAEVDIDVEDGGEWLAIEFNMGEGGGGDSGVVYWDYDPDAPEGDRLQGAEGFPFAPEEFIDPVDAEGMFIPDTHLRSTISPLLSADLVGTLPSEGTGFEFEVDGDTDTADVMVVDNPDPEVFTTVLDVDGVVFSILGTGDLQQGDSFQIIDADQIVGTPTVVSSDPDQSWNFNTSTGFVTFGAAVPGDFNGDGSLGVDDINMLAAASAEGNNPAQFDLSGDGVVDDTDIGIWTADLFRTWIGDSNLDGEFNSGDFVQVFTAGKFEQDTAANWEEGDWNGDGVFNSTDFVAAFTDGGFEQGPRAATAAVPEPSASLLTLLALPLLGCLRRRRSA